MEFVDLVDYVLIWNTDDNIDETYNYIILSMNDSQMERTAQIKCKQCNIGLIINKKNV